MRIASLPARRPSWTTVVASLCLLSPITAFALPAFPGAEGFGAQTKGGRGGKVYLVTSLEDSGPGTLREALEAEGPRTVVFRVGGTISLESQIKVSNPYLTIAGQTAPGDGILIRKGKSNVTPIRIATHDVVIRFIRIRSGDSPDASQTDCIEIFNEQDGRNNVHDIILDHCSFSWSTDENMAIMGRYTGPRPVPPGGVSNADYHDAENVTYNVTVQWCINAEGLHTPQIGKSRAALLKFMREISYHHNLMAHFTAARNPRLQGHRGTIKDVVNNVVYNVGRYGTGPSDGVLFNYVGNYQKSGPDTGEVDFSIGNYRQKADFQAYLKDNYHSVQRPSDDLPEELIMEDNCRSQVVTTPFPAPPVRTTSALQAYEEVLQYAGCIVPRRDAVDERIIHEVRTGTGRIKTSVADAGGYPEIRGGTPPADTDEDGMPDEWEIRHGLDPRDPTDRNHDRNGDGYTNLEEYLNSLVPLPPPLV